MAKVEGIGKLAAYLKERITSSQKSDDASVTVGYTAAYAVYVHENLEAHHPVGQAKYLEQPARLNGDSYGEVVRDAVKKGVKLDKALLLAGLRLQRDSQQLVPVDTGALRASAFTRPTGEE